MTSKVTKYGVSQVLQLSDKCSKVTRVTGGVSQVLPVGDKSHNSDYGVSQVLLVGDKSHNSDYGVSQVLQLGDKCSKVTSDKCNTRTGIVSYSRHQANHLICDKRLACLKSYSHCTKGSETDIWGEVHQML